MAASSIGFSGWTKSANFDTVFNLVTTAAVPGPEDGTHYAMLGPTADNSLSQTFADTPGNILNVSGWMLATAHSPSKFSISVNNTSLISLLNSGVDTQGKWKLFSFAVTATGLDTLTLTVPR